MVTIEDPPRMNLLGLMLASILERNLSAEPRGERRLRRLAGGIVIRCGEMAVTLRYDGQAVVIARGALPTARTTIGGSLDTLLRLALGGGMVGPVLSGKLRPKGSLGALLALRRLLRVARPS